MYTIIGYKPSYYHYDRYGDKEFHDSKLLVEQIKVLGNVVDFCVKHNLEESNNPNDYEWTIQHRDKLLLKEGMVVYTDDDEYDMEGVDLSNRIWNKTLDEKSKRQLEKERIKAEERRIAAEKEALRIRELEIKKLKELRGKYPDVDD